MKLLLIEDDQSIASSLKRGLEIKGFIVDHTAQGRLGCDYAISNPYDLMIIDWMIPEISGVQIVKEVRSEGITTPILMLTAKNQVKDRVYGLTIGADDYLAKPFSFEELIARIHALLRRPLVIQPQRMRLHDLCLDTSNYQVHRSDTLIALSTKEYQLLQFLMRHKHQVVTTQQIIDNVWTFDADILPNTVQVYIGYVRKKIDKAFPEKPALIHTIRGVGYMLSDQNE